MKSDYIVWPEIFHNPRATYVHKWGSQHTLKWEAFLFGIEYDSSNKTYRPILGVYWGYNLPKNEKPKPITIKELSKKDFKKLFKKYKIEEFISDNANFNLEN